MRLSPEQLAQHCQTALKPLYVISGDEPLSQTECLDTLRAAARAQGAEERANFIAEQHFKWSQVLEAGHSGSLFSSKKILEIHIPSGKPGTEGAKILQEIANQPPQDCVTIIILPELNYETKNAQWALALQASAAWISVKVIAPQDLPAWLNKRLARVGQSADQAGLEFIAQRVEGNLLAAHQEINKLSLLYPAGALSLDQIQQSVLDVARFDLTQLSEAILNGEIVRSSRILQGLAQEGEPIVPIINNLMWLFRPVHSAKQAEAQGENRGSAMRNAKIFGDKQIAAQAALNKLSKKQLEAAVNKLADLDKMAKGMLAGDAWLELSRLCFGLSRLMARRPSRT